MITKNDFSVDNVMHFEKKGGRKRNKEKREAQKQLD
jgi:hypothetical protein